MDYFGWYVGGLPAMTNALGIITIYLESTVVCQISAQRPNAELAYLSKHKASQTKNPALKIDKMYEN